MAAARAFAGVAAGRNVTDDSDLSVAENDMLEYWLTANDFVPDEEFYDVELIGPATYLRPSGTPENFSSSREGPLLDSTGFLLFDPTAEDPALKSGTVISFTYRVVPRNTTWNIDRATGQVKITVTNPTPRPSPVPGNIVVVAVAASSQVRRPPYISYDLGNTYFRASALGRRQQQAVISSSGAVIVLGSPEGLTRSTDCGQHWDNLPVLGETCIAALAASSDLHTIAVGQCSSADSILLSRDAGSAWSTVQAPSGCSASTLHAVHVSPDGSTIGVDVTCANQTQSGLCSCDYSRNPVVCYCRRLYLSRDYGVTWDWGDSVCSTPGNERVAVLSDNAATVVSLCYGASAAQPGHRLLIARSPGSAFSDLPVLPPANVSSIYSLTAWAAFSGSADGQRLLGVRRVYGRATDNYTTLLEDSADGGRTWSSTPLYNGRTTDLVQGPEPQWARVSSGGSAVTVAYRDALPTVRLNSGAPVPAGRHRRRLAAVSTSSPVRPRYSWVGLALSGPGGRLAGPSLPRAVACTTCW